MNNYYVYEWIRLDTNEPFYVGKGKGKGNRCYRLTRKNNHHFNNIVKSIPTAVNILHDNLEEQIAYDLECYYIWLYRDEIGYDLCNMNDGGEGCALCGKNNPMYNSHRYGENAPMYGKHHSVEAKKKMSENHANVKGKNNPRYGKRYLVEGKNNPRARSVICLTTKKIFFTAKEGGEYYRINRTMITMCCKGYRTRKGKKIKVNCAGKLTDGTPLIWRYLVWKHNKFYRVKKI